MPTPHNAAVPSDRMPLRMVRCLLGAGIAVPVLYYGLQAGAAPFVPTFAFATTTASELGASGSPVATVFNAGVIVMSIVALLAAIGALVALRRLGHGWIASLAVVVPLACLGLQTLHAGLYPMPDPRHPGPAALLPGVLMVPFAGAWLAWRHRTSLLLRLAMLSAALLLLAMVPVMSGALGIDTTAWRGVLQRVLSLTVFPPFGLVCGMLLARLPRPGEAKQPPSPRSARTVRVLALLSVLLLPTMVRPMPPVATATESRPALAELWARSAPLATVVQQPSQSDADFLLQVAALVDVHTRRLAAEVCGVFERHEPGPYLVVVLLTQGSPAFCVHRRAIANHAGLEGWTIHSHVDPGIRPDPRCAALRLDESRAVLPSRPGRQIHFLGARFSEADIAAGPGFLVHRGRVWQQDGPGTQRLVGRVGRQERERAEMLAIAPSHALHRGRCA